MNNVLFSRNSDDWATPKDLYNHFINDLKCIDPCPLYCEFDNINKICENSNIYINPPYSKINEWVDFIEKNILNNNVIYLLIPARTDTKYFHKLMNFKSVKYEIVFIKGRLKFSNKGAAPFASLLIKLYYAGYESISIKCLDQNELLNYK